MGLISGLQRFSIHDGPGIRTLVFTKGCPLRCLWCDNPETQLANQEISYRASRCIRCGECVKVCQAKAVRLSKRGRPRINRRLCVACGRCTEACPSGAMTIIGQRMAAEQLLCEVEKDVAFYRNSGGGITIGGGEPAVQAEFVTTFLKICKGELGINTAVETSGYTRLDSLEQITLQADLIYYDIKHLDPAKHRELTGVPNDLILENLKKISQQDRQVIIRIPVIPGYNDSDDNMRETAKFIANLGRGIRGVELLPYHGYGISKYKQLGRRYRLKNPQPPSDEQLSNLKVIIETSGIKAKIGN